MHGTASPNRVKQYRTACRLTHEQLAERVGTSRNTIGMVERGQQAPSIDLARRIARALETDLNTLFDDVESSEPEAVAS